ncbi:MAG: TIGR01212 family radical SAM protein [Acidobacteria bacterium]|nr:MAG: TIGR01212 family radical SAM protein [Acidobacteriota bacterium]
MPARYTAYGPWLRNKFGGRVYKVSVDGGFTCPNRDGSVARGGCTYCNNDSFRATGVSARHSVEDQVQKGIAFLSNRYQAEKFLVYWQHYTNTYGPVDLLRRLFVRSLEADERVVGLSIGTRADCVEDEKLEMLQDLAQTHFITLEYGLESIYDSTLARLNRGHDRSCFEDAVRRTRKRGLPICTHVILGFPWETREQMLSYPDYLNSQPIDFLKIHHLHVVKHTALGREYLADPFWTFSYPEWICFVCNFLERLSPHIVVQRLYGWAPDQDLIAPKWGKAKAVILRDIEQELERRNSWQGKDPNPVNPVNPVEKVFRQD